VAADVGAESPARAATERLLDLGHLTGHHLAGPQRWFAARDRLAGWRAALAAGGSEQPPVLTGDWSAASGYAAGRELARTGGATAIFAASDDMATGLIRALAEAGLRVPEDVSVVGFDDIPVSAYVTPPLTSVRQPLDAVAREGLRLLVQAIEKPDAEPVPVSDPPVELVVRASTPPPTDRAAPRGRRTTARPYGDAHAAPAPDHLPTPE
jgi:DNA-binding LacI/PurR family transcriptional regulator